jgi:hypothetical protein
MANTPPGFSTPRIPANTAFLSAMFMPTWIM